MSLERAPPGEPPDVDGLLVDWVFRCFRCLIASSVCSLILIERRAGAISSDGESDFDRLCLLLVCDFSLRAGVRSKSDSDSEDIPDDDEPDGNRRPSGASPPLLLFSSKSFVPSTR